MRVITGKYKGRKLVAPKGETRPTLDRTKETLFNILNPKILGASVLDLFAGSGQLGIECLSRGALRVVFCDNGSEAVKAVKANCEQLGVTPELFRCDFADCIKSASGQFDLVLLDPPYESGYYNKAMQLLYDCNKVAEGGVVVCEHLTCDVFADEICGFVKYDERKMGTVSFTFYKR